MRQLGIVGLALGLFCGCGQENAGAQDVDELARKNKNPPASIVVGPNTVCVLMKDGKPKCKGKTPFGFSFWLTGKNFTKMAVAGSGAICGLRTGGTIISKGKISCKGDIGGTPSGGGYKEIVAGKEHFCAIDAKDFLHCWGPKCGVEDQQCWLHSHLFDKPKSKGVTGAWRVVSGSTTSNAKVLDVTAAENATCYALNRSPMKQQVGDVNVKCFGEISASVTAEAGLGSAALFDFAENQRLTKLSLAKSSPGLHMCISREQGGIFCLGDGDFASLFEKKSLKKVNLDQLFVSREYYCYLSKNSYICDYFSQASDKNNEKDVKNLLEENGASSPMDIAYNGLHCWLVPTTGNGYFVSCLNATGSKLHKDIPVGNLVWTL